MTGMSRRKRSDVGSPKSAAGGLGQPEDPNEAYIMHILEPHHTLAGIALQYRCVYARAAAACCVRVPAPAHAVWGGHRKDASTLARALAHLLGTRTGHLLVPSALCPLVCFRGVRAAHNTRVPLVYTLGASPAPFVFFPFRPGGEWMSGARRECCRRAWPWAAPRAIVALLAPLTVVAPVIVPAPRSPFPVSRPPVQRDGGAADAGQPLFQPG